ncbi:unnamed protein product, partial [Vitis vinifera]
MSQCSSSLTSYKYNNPALVLFLLFHTLLLFQHSGYLGVGRCLKVSPGFDSLQLNDDHERSKMIPNSRERDFQAKLEDATIEGKFSKAPSSSRQWSAFRNPRIVRVSRSFGGKDRHSKVCTVRGLRDRRIRLSVPTAIQLYDLQDRLGLSQPSKVVDWLLDATKHEIDKLPPLQIPQGNLGQFHQSMLVSHELDQNTIFCKGGVICREVVNWQCYMIS